MCQHLTALIQEPESNPTREIKKHQLDIAYVVQYILCLKLLMPDRAMLLNNKEIATKMKG